MMSVHEVLTIRPPWNDFHHDADALVLRLVGDVARQARVAREQVGVHAA